MSSREIIIETKRIGSAMKVTAMDVDTLTEVSFQAPARIGRAELQKLAAAKINYVLNKKRE